MSDTAAFSRSQALTLVSVICAPLVLALVFCIVAFVNEIRAIRDTCQRDATAQRRAQVLRHAGQLESLLESIGDATDWGEVAHVPQFQQRWERMLQSEPRPLYAAIVDVSGRFVAHSDPRTTATRLEAGWYDSILPAAGPDVVLVSPGALSPTAQAIDVRVPLLVQGEYVGDLHEGLDAALLEQQVWSEQLLVAARWWPLISLTAVLDLAAAASVLVVGRRLQMLQLVSRRASGERTALIAQLASGLAHEIRNPLHTLRINVHTLRRSFSSPHPLSRDDQLAILRESDSVVDRVEELLRDLLRYASTDGIRPVELNLLHELRATVALLTEQLQQKQVELRMDLEAAPSAAFVTADPTRLRQALINLLTFAERNSGSPGQIRVAVRNEDRQVVISISDGGPTLTDRQRLRLFEPFQAIRETGSALGLALVKSFVDDIHGSVRCLAESPSGNRFDIRLPLTSTPSRQHEKAPDPDC